MGVETEAARQPFTHNAQDHRKKKKKRKTGVFYLLRLAAALWRSDVAQGGHEALRVHGGVHAGVPGLHLGALRRRQPRRVQQGHAAVLTPRLQDDRAHVRCLRVGQDGRRLHAYAAH